MKNLLNKPLLGKFPTLVRLAKSSFSLKELKSFLVFFWKTVPFLTVFVFQRIRVTPRLRGLTKFIFMLIEMDHHHGSLFTVKYLKACHVAVQHYISGNKLKSLRTIEPSLPFPSLRNGLPAFIQSRDRAAIRDGSISVIRFWLSLIGIYRVLNAPGKAKLETITNGYTGSDAAIGHFISHLRKISRVARTFKSFRLHNLQAKYVRLSTKAGPNHKFSFAGLFTDLVAFNRYPSVKEAFIAMCELTNSTPILSLFNRGLSLATRAHDADKATAARGRRGMGWDPLGDYIIYPEAFVEYDEVYVRGQRKLKPVYTDGAAHTCELGALVGLPEPAGKIRVIAICDGWTQSLFEPLHKDLFSFLRRLPNDGTFDQEAAFQRAVQKGQESGQIFCADLSAATDRLPIRLQAEILNYLYGGKLGDLWSRILDRPFIMREPFAGYAGGSTIKYGVGQPMGCLSSWAMLAICHHFILQSICIDLGRSEHVWQTCYEILGDDIVIFDEDVYREYCRTMALLGVETNPHKSLVSTDGSRALEFAKRTSLNGKEVSGLSLKLFNSVVGWRDVVPLAITLLDRSLISKPSFLVRALLLKLKGQFRKGVRLERYSPKIENYLQNLTFSLLNYFSRIGMIDSVIANSFVIDPRNRGEQSPLTGGIPLFTAMQDVVTLAKARASFRETGYFDQSRLRLGALKLRADLVGAILLPLWGHAKDLKLLDSMRIFKGKIPHFIEKVIPHMTARYNFGLEKTRTTSLDIDLWKYLYELSLSLVYRGKDDEAKASYLSREQRELFSSTNRTFEKLESLHADLDLLFSKYDWITKLGERSLEVRDQIPWTLKDVRAAVQLNKDFSQLLIEDPSLSIDTLLEQQKQFVFEHGLEKYYSLAPEQKHPDMVLRLGKVPLIPEPKMMSLDELMSNPLFKQMKATAMKRNQIKKALKSGVAKT